MIDSLSQFFFGTGALPRVLCLPWNSDLITWTVLGDAGISIAFKLLPIIILVEARRRRLTVPGWVLALFGSFILLCGFSHDLMIWMLFCPAYWLDATVWWRRARALRHELRSARSNINLLRTQLHMPPMMWPDDTLPPGPDDPRPG